MGTVIKREIPLPRLKQKAQDCFNKWIRERDKDKGCISCCGPVQQAGHYFSAGHYSALRFNEINTNGQCVQCNHFKHSNAINYRIGLIKRYGISKVLDLETSIAIRTVKKWTRFELEQILNIYKIAP